MSLFRLFLISSLAFNVAVAQDEVPAPLTPVVATVETALPTFPLSQPIKKFCDRLGEKFMEYRWGEVPCKNYQWNHVRNSNLGTPIIWTVFGDENSEVARKNTTIIMCGVHGDEITPVKFCFDLLNELRTGNHSFEDKVVVVAPLVAPDSFLKPRPTRTNGRGIDVNRNFPTADWKSEALKRWKNHRSDKRKFPGHKAASEQETIFQMNLILRYKPNKVISVHSPLSLLDYDGPSLVAKDNKSAKELLEQMSDKASGYKVSNYPIFPGSLGNWAGKEKALPTYTLELPNSNPQETTKFWNLFKEALLYAIGHPLKPTGE